MTSTPDLSPSSALPARVPDPIAMLAAWRVEADPSERARVAVAYNSWRSHGGHPALLPDGRPVERMHADALTVGAGRDIERVSRPSLTFADAVRMVAADQRASWPDMSDAEAVFHVRDTMRLPEEPPVMGAYPMDDDGTPLARAYRVVLASQEEPEPHA